MVDGMVLLLMTKHESSVITILTFSAQDDCVLAACLMLLHCTNAIIYAAFSILFHPPSLAPSPFLCHMLNDE